MGSAYTNQSIRASLTLQTSRVLKLTFALVLFSLSTSAGVAQGVVKFSYPAGFYTDEFELELTADPGDQIYYTLDGSIPDEGSTLFTGLIPVEDRSDSQPALALISTISHSYSPWVPPSGPVQLATVIRARAIHSGVWGPISTATYFVTDLGYRRYQIAVVSLVTPKENLFDYDKGIYVLGKVYDDYKRSNPGAIDGLATPANYTQRGDEWEKPAHMELFTPDGNRPIAQDMGIRIHGGGSRSFQQKSIRLYAKDDYGPKNFEYQVFPDQEMNKYKRLIMRNSGQDWMKTSLRDGLMQMLVRHLPFETMAYRPAVLFINGEFWGIANIRERYDTKFFESKFGIDEDEVDQLSGNASIEEGNAEHYVQMLDFIKNGGVADMQRYRYLQTQMDTESFKYYNLAQIYYNNRDWPHNNIEYWRAQAEYDPNAGPGKDGRWRWLMKDTDFGMAWTDRHTEATYNWQVSQNYLDVATRSGHWSTFLLHELLKNNEFKQEFISGYRDLMNTAFRKDRILAVLERMRSTIEPYAEEHLHRWGNSSHRWSMPRDLVEWNSNVNYINRFVNDREDFVNEDFIEKFNLGELFPIRVGVGDTTRGYIRVNKTDLIRPTPGLQRMDYPNTFEMQYFKGHPVTIKAIAYDGYEFSHWLNSNTDTDSVVVTGPTSELVAVFKPVNTVSTEYRQTDLPIEFILQQNYPNPFNPSTQVQFSLPESGNVRLDVLDIHGKLLFTHLDRDYVAGTHQTTIKMDHYASGAYIMMLRSPQGRVHARLITLLK